MARSSRAHTACQITDFPPQAQGDKYIQFCFGLYKIPLDAGPLSISDINNMSDEQYEANHHFIQTAFPNARPSGFLPPALKIPFNRTMVPWYRAMWNNKLGPWIMFLRFLRSLGLYYDQRHGITLQDNTRPRTYVGQVISGHRVWRITRVLWFLTNIGCGDVAGSVLDCLLDLQARRLIGVSDESIAFWTNTFFA